MWNVAGWHLLDSEGNERVSRGLEAEEISQIIEHCRRSWKQRSGRQSIQGSILSTGKIRFLAETRRYLRRTLPPIEWEFETCTLTLRRRV
jgi:hypothetical protein